MKKVILLSSLVLSAMAFTPSASADEMSLRICEYVAANDKDRLRSYLKKNNLKVRSIFSSLKCNNKNLLVFSASSTALEVGEFILGQIPVSEVEESLAQVAEHSKHLEAEARKRIEK